jgi:hypothetical protein
VGQHVEHRENEGRLKAETALKMLALTHVFQARQLRRAVIGMSPYPYFLSMLIELSLIRIIRLL